MRRRSGRPDLVKKPRSALWHLLLSGFVLVASIAVALYIEWRDRPLPETEPSSKPRAQVIEKARDSLQFADVFFNDVDTALAELGLWPELLHKVRGGDVDRIEVQVPADLPLTEVNLALSLAARRRGGRVLSAVEGAGGKRVLMRCGFDSLHTTSIHLNRSYERRRTGRIAIVLDDFGSDSRLFERFCALPQPLTLAILPNTGPVQHIAQRARQSGHQVIVHLPMEPADYPTQNPGDGAVMAHHGKKEVAQIVRQALKQVPNAIGFNNHMGSKVTTDERIMRLVLSEIKARDLLFLDSRTTAESLAYQLARDMGVKAMRRDVFLDEIDEPQAIENKIWDLAAMAGRTGAAIAIGHDRENTLLALEELLPRLESRGFRFEPLDKFLP